MAGPHEEGLAAGQAANPVARGSVTAPSAAGVVPGYTSTPSERSLYRQPHLASQANARLTACIAQPTDPVCQAQRGAVASANTPRPAIDPHDPAIAAARNLGRTPSAELGSLAAYYSGCTLNATSVPATTQPRSCLRRVDSSTHRCDRVLTVDVTRSTNCTPGDWIVQVPVGEAGLGVQCVPNRPASQQHLRVFYRGEFLRTFDLDMGLPLVFPKMVQVLDLVTSTQTGEGIPHGLWMVDNLCSSGTCKLTALVASAWRENCTGGPEAGYTCKPAEPFLKVYGACPPKSLHGGLIQREVCGADMTCAPASLDIAQCYAPSQKPTPHSGTDTTGTYAETYWISAAQRPVVGWKANPDYGDIPLQHVSYVMPLATHAEADRWDDRCAPAEPGSRCTEVSPPQCTDGVSTKLINGVAVSRACWSYTTRLTCSSAGATDACAQLHGAGCKLEDSVCRQADAATGLCTVFEDRYSCPVPTESFTTTSNCPSNVFCLGSNCFDTSAPNDPDFAHSMTMLELARQASVYIDTDHMQVFSGEENRCRDRLLKNCCAADGAGAGMTNQSLFGSGSRLVYDALMNSQNRDFIYHGISAMLTGAGFSGSFTSYGVTVAINGTALPAGSVALYAGESVVVAFDPWSLLIAVIIYVILSMMSCSEAEAKLSMKEGARLCHTVGTWCSKCFRVHGLCAGCEEHTTSKCCFNSVLARIVNEQGRAQIGKGWGDPQKADCSGFTVAQLQTLNFAAMDLSEFYASLMPTLPNVNALQAGSASRVPACYYGQGKCQ